MKTKTFNLGIVIYKDVQPLDVIGPWEVFSFWKNAIDQPVNMVLISEDEGFIECSNQIILKSHCDFKSAPQLDCLIVPGGGGRVIQSQNKALLAFVRQQSKKCKYILSVCTGMFLLYHAGVLKDKSVATYWRAIPEMLELDQVHLSEKRIVKSGNVWTSGGVSSGIDLALEMVKEISGKKIAGQVQMLLEYFPSAKVYCQQSTAKTLPPYSNQSADQSADQSAEIQPPFLPKYIKNYLDKNK
jgi:transcriptional regulator GlxA family with amidase domain